NIFGPRLQVAHPGVQIDDACVVVGLPELDESESILTAKNDLEVELGCLRTPLILTRLRRRQQSRRTRGIRAAASERDDTSCQYDDFHDASNEWADRRGAR